MGTKMSVLRKCKVTLGLGSPLWRLSRAISGTMRDDLSLSVFISHLIHRSSGYVRRGVVINLLEGPLGLPKSESMNKSAFRLKSLRVWMVPE